MSDYKIPLERIEKFLHGWDDEKYIVNLEYDKATNTIFKIKEDPQTGKKVIETEQLKAFCWIKNLNELKTKVFSFVGDKKIQGFYGGNDAAIRKARQAFGIEIKPLRHDDHLRLANGFKYLVTCDQGYDRLIQFFKEGGLSPYDSRWDISGHFMMIKPIEQFLIGTGKRLFKGFETYNDIHKAVFDIETTGLDPNTSRIFLIGIKDNRGFEELLETNLTVEGEIRAIISLFAIIDYIKPSIIGTYNGANFDWPYILRRAELLGLDVKKYAKTLSAHNELHVTKGALKLGGEVEDYEQVNMFGYNIIDIIHSTRRAQAIDSDMKSASLKYVTKYNKVAKKNRVYVDGQKLGKTYQDTDPYFFDDKTGAYCKTRPKIEYMNFITREIMQANPNKIFVFGDNDERRGHGGQAKEMRGEPNAIGIRTKKEAAHNPETSYYTDSEYQENVKKILLDVKLVMDEMKKGKTIVFPSDGIGTGLAKLSENAPRTLGFIKGIIKQLEAYAASFEEVTGKYVVKRYLMDDLWETMEVDNIYNQTGFMLASMIPTTYQRILTMGTAGLWKMLMQAWSFENDLALPIPEPKREFVGGLSRLLKTGFSKLLRKADFNSLYPAIQLAHNVFPSVDISGAMKSMLKYFHRERFAANDLSKKYKKEGNETLSAFYKRKQLPLKIFINSMFGALSAPMAFPWSEIEKGERVTCTARQYLRLMVRFFMKRGYIPLVLDTDGVNFMAPPGGDEHFTYTSNGNHKKETDGKTYKGFEAVVMEFNDIFMKGEMGLGVDGAWPSTLNLARKNYALLEDDGTVKKTGNSIKSKAIASFIEEFLDKGIRLLLEGKGDLFVDLYYSYVYKIVNRQIPLAKIATKSKVKKTLEQYKNRGNNIAGAPLPKQAHMELAIQNNLIVNLGDVLYYVNVGNKKSATDVGFDSDGNPYSMLLNAKQIEEKPDMLGDYNIPRYLDVFNKKVQPLLICFDRQIRDTILITGDPSAKPKAKKKTKKEQRECVAFLNENGWTCHEVSGNWQKGIVDGLSLDEACELQKNGPKPTIMWNGQEVEEVIIQRPAFMLCELELVNGQPATEEGEDTIEELFTPSQMEMDHWTREGYNPLIWDDPNAKFTVPGLGFEREIK